MRHFERDLGADFFDDELAVDCTTLFRNHSDILTQLHSELWKLMRRSKT